MAQRRLRDAELCRGPGEAALPRHSEKDEEVVDVGSGGSSDEVRILSAEEFDPLAAESKQTVGGMTPGYAKSMGQPWWAQRAQLTSCVLWSGCTE